MNPYRHADWVRFRNEVIKLHDSCCARCGRSRADDVILQVHHKAYVSGKMPWEYEHTECEALCKGCHAEEHGIIMPQNGWIWLATDDLGDILDNCEDCGQDIRYVYAIIHPNWGSMAVGTDCCDRLTGTADAGEYHDRYLKQIDMRKRFVSSKRWKASPDGDLCIRQKGINVSIKTAGNKFVIQMDDATGKVEYASVFDAKIKVFDLIASGDAAAYLARRRERKIQRLQVEQARRAIRSASRFSIPKRINQHRR